MSAAAMCYGGLGLPPTLPSRWPLVGSKFLLMRASPLCHHRISRPPCLINSLKRGGRVKRLSSTSQASLNFLIRGATADDLDDLARLDDETAGDGSAGWSRGVWKETYGQDSSLVLVAIEDDTLVGFVSGIQVSNELQVENLAVSRTKRGKRIGSDLMARLIKEFSSINSDKNSVCLLEVREGSQAVQFYQGMGFEIVGRRARFYPDGCAALLMRKTLTSVT